MIDQAEFERRLPALFRQPAAEDDAAPVLAGVRRRVRRARLMRAAMLSGAAGIGVMAAAAAILAVRPRLETPGELWARAASVPAELGLADVALAEWGAERGLTLLVLAAIVLIGLAGLNTLRDA